MALDLALLSRTGVQAVAALCNYTLNTNLNPAWLTCTGLGSPYSPTTTVTVAAITGQDASGNISPYTGQQSITYKRAGFMQAFQGLTLQLNLIPPLTVGQVVAGIKAVYGITLEQADIQQNFAAPIVMDGNNNVSLAPGTSSLRFYIDYSPFQLKVNIIPNQLTNLQKLIGMTQQADIALLNAQNTPPSNNPPPVPQPPDATP
jgi:hypothetical protein